MTKELINRITSSGTITPFSSTCSLHQIVVACANAGTTWTLKIQDKGSPSRIVIPAFTLTLSSTGLPLVNLEWRHFPLRMEGGIDIVTAGTAGEVSVWMTVRTNVSP